MRSLVWFRSDLRVDDNPAFAAALQGADAAEALFLVTPGQWREHDWGRHRIDFVLRSVESLRVELISFGVPLSVVEVETFSDAERRIVEIMESGSFDALFANLEYEVNERRRDRAVERALASVGRKVWWFEDQTVVPPGALRTGAGGPYTVYSPFRRAWEAFLEREGVPEAAPTPEPLTDRLELPTTPIPAGPVSTPDGLAELWPAGEAEAKRRLHRFVERRARSYKADRDIAALDGTSRLSPYLAVGSLSIRRCLEAALVANGGQLSGGDPGIGTWINELVWREFYRHVLVGYPRVGKGRAFRPETESVEWRDDDAEFAAWSEGRTGVPFVDAGMRELLGTGWMHNRLRMVTAMFLTKDLLHDWRRGERFFMQHLVDGDLAQNNGGWQWSASTGTDAAPYFRIFNPWTQGKRYDPDGEYIRRWVPELLTVPARDLHDPERLADSLGATAYPAPIVKHRTARIRALDAFKRAKGEA